MNTPKKRMRATRDSVERAARHGAVPVRSASFVSCFIAADAVRDQAQGVVARLFAAYRDELTRCIHGNKA